MLNILPPLAILGLLAALYGLYLLYLGLPRLMKCPQEKAFGYTVVVVVCAIVIWVVVAAMGTMIVGAGMFGAGVGGASFARGVGGDGGSIGTGSGEVQVDKNSALGKLQALSNKLDESNKKMEAAAKRGDDKAEAAAAMEGLGTLLGGGKRVEPLDIDQLKPFVPATLAGLPKTSGKTERNGIAGLMVTTAEATYSDGASKDLDLEITDTGGVSGLVGVASWANIQGENEDDERSERTTKADGRMVHEVRSKRGGTNEFSLVLGDRFVVTAKSRSMDADALRAAVGSLGLARLESMKDAGVQKN